MSDGFHATLHVLAWAAGALAALALAAALAGLVALTTWRLWDGPLARAGLRLAIWRTTRRLRPTRTRS